MVEHVGYKNYREYMKVARRCLKDGGIFLLHTIGGEKSSGSSDPWIGRYIFPNSHSPSLEQLMKAAEGLFVVEDLHNFGADYDKTLMSWYLNFEDSWPLLEKKYGERFRRMWRYYLLSCAGIFRARRSSLWQIVFSKDGVPGGWKPVR
jgi:cyclopropane-fatty-acyl-phospholipid synthase